MFEGPPWRREVEEYSIGGELVVTIQTEAILIDIPVGNGNIGLKSVGGNFSP